MMDIPHIKIKKLSDDAKIPSLANKADAGLDLASIESVTIPPGHRVTLKTGLAFAIPEGMGGLVWPRSKLANHYGLDVLAGVVDATYRGEVMVSLINLGHEPFEVRKGDKVAQMIIQPTYSWLPIEIVTELDETERGKSGINDSELRLS